MTSLVAAERWGVGEFPPKAPVDIEAVIASAHLIQPAQQLNQLKKTFNQQPRSRQMKETTTETVQPDAPEVGWIFSERSDGVEEVLDREFGGDSLGLLIQRYEHAIEDGTVYEDLPCGYCNESVCDHDLEASLAESKEDPKDLQEDWDQMILWNTSEVLDRWSLELEKLGGPTDFYWRFGFEE